MAKTSNEKNTGVMPPYFLLSFCAESKTDGFFGVLKSIINRKSVDENCFDSSLKSVMSGEIFRIDSEDLVMNWSMLNSHEQRIRQSKLLGYWAIQNFRSFGSTLFGKTWKAPERKSIEVVGPSGSEELQPEEIDEKIFRKLSLRILEINVSSSTLAKLKNFVNVPSTVGKKNEQQISPKIKLFDVDDEYMEKCWRALKSGRNVFDVNFEENGSNTTFPQPEIATHQKYTLAQPSDHQEKGEHQINSTDEFQPVVACKRLRREVSNDNGRADHLDGDSSNEFQPVVACKRLRREVSNDNGRADHLDGDSSNEFQPVVACKRLRREVSNDNGRADHLDGDSSNEFQPVVACKRLRREVSNDNGRADHLDGDSSNDSLRILLEMQKSIGNLTKWLDPEAAVINSEEGYGQERLHVMIVKQKDTEIARFKASEKQLLQMNQSLTNDVSNLKEQMEKQTVLINSLQKGVDASCMLNVKSESDLAACRSLIETMKLEIADKNGENEMNVQLKNQVQELTENLAEARNKNVDMETTNAELQDALHQWKDYAEKLSNELIAANDRLGRNTRLQDELKEMKNYASSVASEMRFEINKLEKDLTEAGNANSQILDQKEKLEQEVTVLKSESDELKKKLTDAAIANSQILDQKEKLRQELIVLKEKHVNNKTTVESQIDSCNETGRQSAKDAVNEFVPNDIITIGSAAIDKSNNQESHSEPLFVSDDPIVQKCRDGLKKLKFGWIKFVDKKNAKYCPAFVHPPDTDGKERAQRVSQDGYVTSRKYPFSDIKYKIDEKDKGKKELYALNKFNEKFKFNYV